MIIRGIINWLKGAPANLRKYSSQNSALSLESLFINIKRIRIITVIAIPMHISCIIIFSRNHASGAAEINWKSGIMLAHSVLLFIMILFYFISSAIRKRPTRLGGTILVCLMLAILLTAGIMITLIDHLVTTNITPFLLVCLIMGTMFLIRPGFSFWLFFISYGAFHFIINSREISQAMLFSNWANGIMSAGIGFSASLIMWHQNSISWRQKKQIESQKMELERVNGELARLAFTDDLTGIPNRRYIDSELRDEIAAVKCTGCISSIIVLDIDNFKRVNDTYGHIAGDAVLIKTARMISSFVDGHNLTGRYGGEEFIILLRRHNAEQAARKAEVLRRAIEEYVYTVENAEIRITISLGVMAITPGDQEGIDYYAKADEAMYRAKKGGKNRVEIWSKQAQTETP